MHEREITISTKDVVLILECVGIDERFLNKLGSANAVKPERSAASGRPRCWGPEDIFRAFACKVMLDEYKEKYANNSAQKGSDLQYVRRFLPGLKFGGFKRFVCLPDWEKVTKMAAKQGIDFGKTEYRFVPQKD